MPMTFHPLELKTLAGALHYAKPEQIMPAHVEPSNPAMDVMTDLGRVSAATITPSETIDHALQVMIKKGVRLLLVEDHDHGIIGLITATDIQGEKPMRLVQETSVHHSDIIVGDLMTPINQAEIIDMDIVRRSHVGDVVRTLTQDSRQHALVVEQKEGEEAVIRGIFSTSQIGRQMGMPINTSEKAQTFAELEMAIAG